MKKSILLVAAAIGMLAASCNKEILDPQEDLTQTPITISAKYDSNNSKVSYTESGSNITATWDAGDELIVCWNNHKNTLTLSSGAGTSSATFTGTITGTPSANSTLVCFVKDSKNPGAVTVSDNGDYLYTSDAFLTQDGSMDSAASRNLYYGTCFYGDGTNISCTFNVNTSMMKFTIIAPYSVAGGTTGATLTYMSNDTEIAKATFNVATNRTNTIYLTIPAGHYTGEQKLIFHSGSITETEILSSTQANFRAGQTYSKEVEFYSPLSTPLTFEAKTAGATITFTPVDGVSLPLEYSTDGSTWLSYSSVITLPNVGDKVMFRGNNAKYGIIEYDEDRDMYIYGSHFSCSGSCYIYGNVMSLIRSTNYATLTSMTSSNKTAFYELFKNNAGLYNHSTKTIVLPATTLSDYCYEGMFRGCTNLTSAPELPATTLAEECYYSMFNGCTKLSTAPELPATTLDRNCYNSMFENCTSLSTPPQLRATSLANSCYCSMFKNCTVLSTAPSLPATKLAVSCYYSMFYGCTSLATAPNLPATTLANECYSYMFYGCSNLSSAPIRLPATTLKYFCYAFMFTGCSSLTTAPELPATTVTDWCYNSMFSNCTNLNSVKCLAINGFTSAEMWCNSWLWDVAATGTFTKASGANWTSQYGIPSGWTILEE